MTTDWYASHENLVSLAEFMNDRGDFLDPEQVIYFFEKPWKYPDEWADFCAAVEAVSGPMAVES